MGAPSRPPRIPRRPKQPPTPTKHTPSNSHPINSATRAPATDPHSPNRDNAHSRVRDVQSGQADGAPDLRRRRLRRQQSVESGAGLYHQRAVGAEHDGAVGAGGAGQVLLPGGREPLGEVRTLEGQISRAAQALQGQGLPVPAAELHSQGVGWGCYATTRMGRMDQAKSRIGMYSMQNRIA